MIEPYCEIEDEIANVVTTRRTFAGKITESFRYTASPSLPGAFRGSCSRRRSKSSPSSAPLFDASVYPILFSLKWRLTEPKPTLVKLSMLSYQRLGPIHSNSLRKGSLDGKQLLRKQKRMEAQMELSRTVGQYKVCRFVTNKTITNNVFSCTTKKNSSCVEPGTPRNSPGSPDQRRHLSTSSKLLVRDSQNHTQDTYIRL